MFLRWLHKSWKYFWGTILVLLLAIVILAGAAIGLLHLDVTQNYLAQRIEQKVEKKYAANLSIGAIEGFVPFGLKLNHVVLTENHSSRSDTLAAVESLKMNMDLWGLLQNKISINEFAIDGIKIWLRGDENGVLTFLQKNEQKLPDGQHDEPWFSTVEVLAPTIEINDGAVYVTSFSENSEVLDLPSSFSLTNIGADFFIEWRDEQRFLNIENFLADANNLGMNHLSFSGQLYNDQQVLEFNSFHLNIGDSEIILNGEINGFNLYEPNLPEQLLAAHYKLDVYSAELFLSDLNKVLPVTSKIDDAFSFRLQAQGTAKALDVSQAYLGMGESYVEINGRMKNLRDKEAFKYRFQIKKLNLEKPQLKVFFDSLASPQYRALANMNASGKTSGDLDSVHVNMGLSSPLGTLSLKGWSRLQKPYTYSATINGQKVDISSLAAATVDTTSLNFEAKIDGSGFTLREADTKFTATFTNSSVDGLTFDRLKFSSSLTDGFLQQRYEYRNGEKFIRGSGRVDFSEKVPPVSLQGNAQNINLAKIFGESVVAPTKLNFDYNIEMRGLTLNQIRGRANLDIKTSVIGGDTVRAHQIYMDLNSPSEDIRTFRLTSSLFDLNISGPLVPGNIIDQAKYWSSYLSNRFKAEILMNAPSDSIIVPRQGRDESVVFNGTLKTKDLSLIEKYLPDFPRLQADSKITFNVHTDGTRLLLSAEVQVDSLQYGPYSFKDSRTQLTASFRSDRTLKEFSSINLHARLGSMQIETMNLDSVDINFSLKGDSVYYAQQISSISENAHFNIELHSALSDSSIAVSVPDFFLGNNQYSWVNRQTPSFVYKRDGSVVFKDFRFRNQDEYFQLNGTLSADRSDSLKYVIRDVHLERISELLNGRISFAGILNGTFITRSLTQRPSIQGELSVNRFALDNRLVGDVSFNSRYNAKKDRFDTKIGIVTDSTKYQNYLAVNDNIGQNIVLSGYFITPNPKVKQDSLFYFDANFKQIDMWVIPLLLENIFAEMEGQASGDGYITGNFKNIDFHADFNTRNVFAKPRFVNTNLFVNGHVIVDRQQGVFLDSLDVIDTKGGSGTVWGTIDLNDFKPIKYLDLTLKMDKLQFLNNSYDPDIPFYGNVSGTGLVRLTGSNTDVYLRTETPVELSSKSEVSIPLLEETELNQTGKFIRFVDSFEEGLSSAAIPLDGDSGTEEVVDEEALEAAIEKLTFSERFDLDLQFVAPNNVTVHLIFDPVTGEVLTAQGTGQLRITMQDQNVQMFGLYNINSGSYQFVTGEIISRELELVPGGSIV
ncbi:MAG TPA: AsmA family protein, partial [Balneolaceae bacterium]|nr:AsmA family protein [Balneolaceae bacterium]